MLNKLIKIVKEAGLLIETEKKKKLNVKFKDDETVVTNVDLIVNKFLVEKLNEEFLEIFVLAEESVSLLNTNTYFAVDPIDGTAEFVNSIKYPNEKYIEYSVQLGYVENGILKIGIVYMPAIDRFYFAEKNKGAFVEQDSVRKQIFTKKSDKILVGKYNIDDNLISILDKKYSKKLDDAYLGGGFGVKVCYVAEGKYDSFVHTNYDDSKIHASLWDSCGPDLILSEAGGRSFEIKSLESVNYSSKKIELTNGYIANSNVNDKILIFDIDGTLANFDKLLEYRYEKFIREISIKGNLSLDNARELFFNTKFELKKFDKYSTIDAMKHLGFSEQEFYDMMNDVSVENRIFAFDGVKEVLKELSLKYRMVVLTNTPYIATIETLKYLEVFEYFDGIYSIDKNSFVKPSVNIYEKILLDFNCKDGYSIGNSVEKDLVPAKEVGLKTILINNSYDSDFVDYKITGLRELLKINGI